MQFLPYVAVVLETYHSAGVTGLYYVEREGTYLPRQFEEPVAQLAYTIPKKNLFN